MADIILLRDFQASQIEFWLPTAFVGYDVSSFGRVRSWWARKSLGVGKGSEAYLGTVARILRTVPQSGGYRAVGVGRTVNGRPKHVALHRLVAKAFIPPIEGMSHVNHLNLLKSDCRAGNLEWTIPKRNTQHAIDAGVIRVIGVNNPMARLTTDDVREIRELRRLGVDCQEVAARFRITPAHVYAIEQGRRWGHVS